MKASHLLEKIRKGRIYIGGGEDYWRPPISPSECKKDGVPYIIDFTPRLVDGHFVEQWFDEDGIPRRPASGELVYNITRVCGYALANYDQYLRKGDAHHMEKFIAVARWLAKHGEVGRQGFYVPYRYRDKEAPKGRNSGMSHGQVLSVFCRVARLDASGEWENLASSMLGHYRADVEEEGIRVEFPEIQAYWYEESCHNKSHILNGYIYAIEGLRDMTMQFGNTEALKLYEESLDNVERALPLYDTGFWSFYDRAPGRPVYVASYSYHLMHCVLLGSLSARHPERETLRCYAQRWKEYLGNFPCRMKAAAVMVKQKVYDRAR